MNYLFIVCLPLLVGFLLDALLGDPRWIPHPIVGFGKLIRFFEEHFNQGKNKKLKGVVSVIILTLFVFCLFFALEYFSSRQQLISIIITSVFVFLGLANHTLIKEVWQVELALKRSLEEGRIQVQRIVGRDTSALSEQQVRKAALETLAENLSDGVVAPLFYFLLGGLPGLFTYKMINTLDSMVGYKTDHLREFGWFAAKLDDVANFIPARITAFLMALLSFKRRPFKFLHKYGRAHASPNAGYPEAALAGILNCRFGGSNIYHGQRFDKPFIGYNERELNEKDVRLACRINASVSVLCVIIICAIKIWIISL